MNITAAQYRKGKLPEEERRGRLTARMAVGLAAPHTFPASAGPAIFGLAYCASRGFPLTLPAAAALFAACLLMQAAVNTFNDYIDFVKGTDTAEDQVEESDSILVYSDLAPSRALALGIVFLAAAAVIGCIFAVLRGPAPILVGIVGALAVVLYSAGPLPVSSLPLGELVSGTVMGGLIPLGITAAVTGEIHPEILPWCIPFILGIGLIMMTNNTCDIEKDLRAGRRTLSCLLGRERAVILYRVLVAIWMAAIVLFAFSLGPAAGAAGVLLMAAAYRSAFRFLLRSPVSQETRILQMKGILKANVQGMAICILLFAGTAIFRMYG